MVNVYLSGADARNAAADLWQQDQLKRLNDQFAPPPPPPEPAQPLPPAPVEAAGVQGSSLPSPPAVGPGVTQPAPPVAVPAPAPAPVVAPNPTPDRNDIADRFTRNAVADAWEQNAISDVMKGVSQAGQGVQSALSQVPQQAQGLVSNYTALPGVTPSPPAQTAPSAPAGIPRPPVSAGQVATVTGPQDTNVQVDSSSPEAFIRSIAPAAQAAAARLGVPAEALIGMAANETGYGKFAAGNNLFGIKGKGPAGSTNAGTWEDYGNGPVQIRDNFRAYNNAQESFNDFADLIAGSDRYKAALGQPTVEGFVGALKQGGYMTDPNYVGKISSIVKNFGPTIQDAMAGAGQAVQSVASTVGAAAQPISRPAEDWLAIAKEQLGKPYIWGSAGGRSTFDPNAPGFDCSGFVSYVMKKAFGVDLPAFTGTAYTATRPLQEGETPGAAGQVAFYNMGQADPHLQHIALSIGNGQVIQAGGRRNDVNTDVANDIGTPEWRVPVGIPGKLADAAQQVVGAGAAAAQVGQNAQQAIQQTAQGLIGTVSNLAQPVQQTAQGIIGAVGNIGQGIGSAWQQAGQANAANPMIQNMIASSSPSTINPYRDIVQEGIPGIVQGVQQGDVGRVLGSALQTFGGVTSGLPGGEGQIATGAGGAVRSIAENPDVQAALRSRMRGEAEVGFAMGLPTGGQPRTGQEILQNAMSNLGQYPAEATQAIRDWAQNAQAGGTPASTIGATVQRWMGENPASAYMQPPTLGRDVASTLPPGSGPLAAPAPQQSGADLLQAMVDQARSRGVNPAELEDAQAEINRMRASETGQRPPAPPAQPPTAQPPAQPPNGVPGPLPPNEYLPSGPQAGQFGMFGQELPYGGLRPAGGEAIGPGGPQPGQFQFGSELPYGGPAPIGGEALGPAGPQRGQFQFGSELPVGGPRPTGTEPLAPGAQPGQFQFGSELPLGGARPTGTEPLATGAQPGQFQFGSELPLGGPAPTGAEAQGAAGPLVGQMRLPGFPNPQTATPLELFRAYHTGNVVSSPATAVHVALNSVISPVWSLGTHSVADLLGGTLNAAAGAPTGNLGRAVGRGAAVGSAMSEFGRNLAQGFSEFYANPANVANKIDNPLASGLLKAQQAVGAALHSSFQNASQAATTRLELAAQAGERAWNEGARGQELMNRIGDLMTNPTPDMLARAQDVGTRAALRGSAGATQQVMQKIAEIPFIGNTLFPVVRIAAQSIAQGVEKSPLGLAGTGFDVARAAAGKGPYAGPGGFSQVGGAVTPLADRLTNNLAGTALTTFLTFKALDGTITGNGPDDPKARATLQSQGWQPNSVYVPGRGYMDYHALGPLAIPFSIAGNIGDSILYSKPQPGESGGDQVKAATLDLTRRVADYLASGTGMRTIGDMWDLIHGGANAGAVAAQFAGSVAGGFVPMSAALRASVAATDPFQRRPEAGNVQQIVQQGLPGGTPLIGGRQDLPIRQDVLGRPEANPQQGIGAVLPRTGTGQPDPMLMLLSRAGIELPATAPKTISYSGRQIQLTPDERQQRQTLFGQRLQQTLQGYLKSQKFQTLPPEQQYRALEPVVRAAGTYADQRLVAEMPAADRRARMATAPRAYGAGVVPYLAAGSSGGLASVIARQSGAEADAAHQRLIAQYSGQPAQPQLAAAS